MPETPFVREDEQLSPLTVSLRPGVGVWTPALPLALFQFRVVHCVKSMFYYYFALLSILVPFWLQSPG